MFGFLDSFGLTMTIKKELFRLYDSGKNPAKCMELGYKRSSAYRFYKEWLFEKEKTRVKILIDESETAKTVFSYIKQGKSPEEIVLEEGIPPKKVLELYEDYIKLKEKSLDYVETASRLDENTRKLDEIKVEIKKLEPKALRLRKDFDELVTTSKKNFISCLKKRTVVLEGEIEGLEMEIDFSGYGHDKEKKKKLVEQFNEQIVVRRREISKIEAFLDELTKKEEQHEVFHEFLHR